MNKILRVSSLLVAIVIIAVGLFGVDSWIGLTARTAEAAMLNVPSPYATIQAAVTAASANDTIQVAPGTYEEQVVINKTGLTIIGSGSGDNPATNTIVRSPVSLTYYFMTGSNYNKPIVAIDGVTGVSLKNCRVDGAGRGNSNYRFVGVAFWNAGGAVNDCYILGIIDTPFAGAQHGNGIYAYNNTNGPYTINIGGTTIVDCQKNGMTLLGNGLIAYVTNCVVSGHGPTAITAQNGIQIGYGASGTVSGCAISGFAYTGAQNAVASGILLYQGNVVDVSGATSVTGSQACILYQETQGSVNGVDITTSGVIHEEGIGIRDYGYALASSRTNGKVTFLPVAPMDEELASPGYIQASTGTTVNITNANLTGANYAGSYGIATYSMGGASDNVTVNVGNCRVHNWEIGIVSADFGTGAIVNVPTSNCRIYDNSAGFWTNALNVQNIEHNWWGSYFGPYHATLNPGGLGNEVDGTTDFMPWCDSTFTKCDFTTDPPDTVWVDDDYSSSGANDGHYWDYDAFASIQDGIDSVAVSGVVIVQSGTYEEQIVITKSGITIVGSGSGSDPATNSIIHSPVTLPYMFATSAPNHPIVGVDGVTGITLRNFRIDGAGRGNANYRFIGIAFWDAGGSVDGCYITGITETPFNGSQHGVGIYAYNNTDGPYTVNINGTTINYCQKNAMALNGNGLTANVSNCTVSGHGATAVTAENGIQIAYGASGTVTGCTVSGYAYTGAGWGASGMLFLDGGTVNVSGLSSITGCQTAIAYEETQGSINGVNIGMPGMIGEQGISVTDNGVALSASRQNKIGRPTSSPLNEKLAAPGSMRTNSGTNVSIANANLVGLKYAGSYGISVWSYGGPGENVTVAITGSTIRNWEYGVVSVDGGGGPQVNVSAATSRIYDNDSAGFWSNAANVQNVEHNWWGAYCGPYHAILNPNGQGNTVDGTSDFIPWCDSTFTKCDFTTAAPDTVWVDDSYTPDGVNDGHFWCHDAFATIQAGINAVAISGVVIVGGGNYVEQVEIGKSLKMVGVTNPVVQAPSGTLKTYTIPESGSIFEPIIMAYGGVNDGLGNITGTDTIAVTITGFAIDGNNAGIVNRFVAIMARNCRSSLLGYNNIYEMLYSSGLPQTSGILLYGNSNATIDHNIVNDWTRGGIVVNGDLGSLPKPTAVISNNTVVGEGVLPLGNWAQNGIQIGYGAGGSIIGNDISEISILDPDWSASGIGLMYGAPGIVLSGNNVHNCQGALNAYYVDNLVINNNNIFNQNDFIFVLGGNNALISGNTFTNNYQGLYLADATNAQVSNNAIQTNDFGIIADGVCTGPLFTQNHINSSTTCGVTIQPYDGISPSGVVFHSNDISSNTYGIANTTPNMINATGNWWGDASGPIEGTLLRATSVANRPALSSPADRANPNNNRAPFKQNIAEIKNDKLPTIKNLTLATGNAVSPLVDYSPWWGANYVGDSHINPWRWYVNISNNSTIQEGVDGATDGDAIYLTENVYSTPVNFDSRNNISIIGLSQTGSIFKPSSTQSWAIPGYPQYNSRGAAVRAINSLAIQLSNMTIDLDLVKGNNICGIFYWNSTGIISNNIITNNSVSDALGGYYELTSYFRAPRYSDTLRADILVKGNQFSKTGRIGVITHDYVHAVIDSNSFIQAPNDFGYAIELGSTSTGVITRNTISKYHTFALSDSSSVSGIYVENAFTSGFGHVAKPVTIANNEIYDCQFGLWVGNDYPGYAGDVDITAIVSNNKIHDNTGGEPLVNGGAFIVDEGRSEGSSVTANFANNVFGQNGDVGIYFNTYGNGEIHAAVNGDTITGHNIGVIKQDKAAGTTQSSYDIAIHNSAIFGNAVCALSNDSVPVIHAENNWWGHMSGPHHVGPCPVTHLSNPLGMGDSVTNYIYYTPWILGICDYIPGDINGDGAVIGGDVTYGVRYFKLLGTPPPDSCLNDSTMTWLYSAGDVNGNCEFRGSDITYLVAYFKGINHPLKWCSRTPPPHARMILGKSATEKDSNFLERARVIGAKMYE